MSNAALSGELGWMSLKGRRTILRLSLWGKVLRMAPQRWAKRAYERSKELLEQGGRVSEWCADIMRCLEQLRLQEWWSSQEVPDDWKELVRGSTGQRGATVARASARKRQVAGLQAGQTGLRPRNVSAASGRNCERGPSSSAW